MARDRPWHALGYGCRTRSSHCALDRYARALAACDEALKVEAYQREPRLALAKGRIDEAMRRPVDRIARYQLALRWDPECCGACQALEKVEESLRSAGRQALRRLQTADCGLWIWRSNALLVTLASSCWRRRQQILQLALDLEEQRFALGVIERERTGALLDDRERQAPPS